MVSISQLAQVKHKSEPSTLLTWTLCLSSVSQVSPMSMRTIQPTKTIEEAYYGYLSYWCVCGHVRFLWLMRCVCGYVCVRERERDVCMCVSERECICICVCIWINVSVCGYMYESVYEWAIVCVSVRVWVYVVSFTDISDLHAALPDAFCPLEKKEPINRSANLNWFNWTCLWGKYWRGVYPNIQRNFHIMQCLQNSIRDFSGATP